MHSYPTNASVSQCNRNVGGGYSPSSLEVAGRSLPLRLAAPVGAFQCAYCWRLTASPGAPFRNLHDTLVDLLEGQPFLIVHPYDLSVSLFVAGQTPLGLLAALQPKMKQRQTQRKAVLGFPIGLEYD